MKSTEQVDMLAAALSEAQGGFEAVAKTSTNPFFKSKYADLPSVVAAASPILCQHGLSITQSIGSDEKGDTLTTRLMHKSGQWLEDTMQMRPIKDDPQAQGSAVTYARRYGYMSILGLVADVDDDGNASAAPAAATGRKRAAPSAPAEPRTRTRGAPTAAPAEPEADPETGEIPPEPVATTTRQRVRQAVTPTETETDGAITQPMVNKLRRVLAGTWKITSPEEMLAFGTHYTAVGITNYKELSLEQFSAVMEIAEGGPVGDDADFVPAARAARAASDVPQPGDADYDEEPF